MPFLRHNLSSRYCQVNCRKLVESVNEYIQATQIPNRHHQLCRLALLQIRSQLSRNRRSSRRERRHCKPRIDSLLAYQVRSHLCTPLGTKSTEATAILSILRKSSPVCRTILINGKQHYLWRAVDQDGDGVDVYPQARRDGAAAKRFFKRLLRSRGSESRKIVTDKLRSYGVVHRELNPQTIHVTDRYANNRAEQSHEAGRGGREGCGS